MKILFDQNIPVGLRHHLPGHQIATAAEMGWSDLTNGKLLAATDTHGFQVMLSADQKIAKQQNLSHHSVALVVLNTNHWPSIHAQGALILEAIERASERSYFLLEVVPPTAPGRHH